MKRQNSPIVLNRQLVEQHGHFPAMVLDCLKNRIETYFAASDEDERYCREKDGLLYVKASGRFVANWLMCDRSTVNKALAKLQIEKAPDGEDYQVLDQQFLTGKQNGAWYAFMPQFIAETSGFFDPSVKRQLLIIAESAVADIPATGEDNIATSGGDNIATGEDNIATSGDNIATSPIYNTINTNHHLKGNAGAGGFDDSFLGERDEPYRKAIAETLASFPYGNSEDVVELIKLELGWNRCKISTQRTVKQMAYDYGFDIYAAAVVIAGQEQDLKSPLSFISKVCKRLRDQKETAARSRRIVPPAPPQTPAPRSSKSVQELVGQSFADPDSVNLADFR